MKRTVFLTREQEQDLAIRWRDHRDESAMHQIVMAYRPLVAGPRPSRIGADKRRARRLEEA